MWNLGKKRVVWWDPTDLEIGSPLSPTKVLKTKKRCHCCKTIWSLNCTNVYVKERRDEFSKQNEEHIRNNPIFFVTGKSYVINKFWKVSTCRSLGNVRGVKMILYRTCWKPWKIKDNMVKNRFLFFPNFWVLTKIFMKKNMIVFEHFHCWPNFVFFTKVAVLLTGPNNWKESSGQFRPNLAPFYDSKKIWWHSQICLRFLNISNIWQKETGNRAVVVILCLFYQIF